MGYLSRRLSNLASAIFSEVSGQREISTLQMGIMITLYQSEVLTLRELSRHMHVDSSTMQEVVQRLVRRGLLNRRSPPNDRRAYELWLTAKGRVTVGRHFWTVRAMQERMLAGISVRNAKVTLSCMRAILASHDD